MLPRLSTKQPRVRGAHEPVPALHSRRCGRTSRRPNASDSMSSLCWRHGQRPHQDAPTPPLFPHRNSAPASKLPPDVAPRRSLTADTTDILLRAFGLPVAKGPSGCRLSCSRCQTQSMRQAQRLRCGGAKRGKSYLTGRHAGRPSRTAAETHEAQPLLGQAGPHGWIGSAHWAAYAISLRTKGDRIHSGIVNPFLLA